MTSGCPWAFVECLAWTSNGHPSKVHWSTARCQMDVSAMTSVRRLLDVGQTSNGRLLGLRNYVHWTFDVLGVHRRPPMDVRMLSGYVTCPCYFFQPIQDDWRINDRDGKAHSDENGARDVKVIYSRTHLPLPIMALYDKLMMKWWMAHAITITRLFKGDWGQRRKGHGKWRGS